LRTVGLQDLSAKRLASDDIVLRARNQGPDEHELIVARIGAPG
jgi:hypothetical protein